MRWSVLLMAVLLTGCGADGAPVEGPPVEVAVPSGSGSPPGPTVAASDGCPEAFEGAGEQPWVPESPTTQTSGRLVPDADPVEALVCRYEPLSDGPSALAGEQLLTDGLTSVRHDLLLPERLPGQEEVCTLVGGPEVPHLVRLRYADGELWLSAVEEANDCTDTGNGDFVTPAYLGDRFATAFDSGAWPPAPVAEPSACAYAGFGRAGQERSFVPDGWESLHVCGPDGAREADSLTAARVVDVLSRVQAQPGRGGCAGAAGTTYDLLFTWPEGPPVTVAVWPGCVPQVRNGSLDGRPRPEQTEELTALLGG